MIISKKQNSLYTYLLLILLILYSLKGAIYPTGLISKSIALLELGICAFLGLKALKIPKRNLTINILYLIFGLVTICYLLSPKIIMIMGKISTFAFYRDFCGAILPAIGIYFLARKNLVTLKLLKIFFVVLFFASIIAFFYETFTTMIEENKENITSNSSYRFVYIMPFIVFLKSKWNVLFFWSIAIIITLLSVKRGAILGLGIECSVYYWWQFRNSKHKIVYIIFTVLLLCLGWHYIYQYYQDNPYVQQRVEATVEGRTSGRDKIISKLFTYYFDSGIVKMSLGSGFANTTRIAGNYAHNDWMEMLIDCGAIGFFLYAFFYISLLFNIRKSQIPIKHLFCLIFLAFLPSSLYSMVFFSESSSMGFLWLGLGLGWKDAKVI